MARLADGRGSRKLGCPHARSPSTALRAGSRPAGESAGLRDDAAWHSAISAWHSATMASARLNAECRLLNAPLTERLCGALSFLKPDGNIRDLRLTLFAGDCYSRRVPIGRGFSVKTSDSWDCPSSLARVGPPQPNDSSSSPQSRSRIRLSERHNFVRRDHRPQLRIQLFCRN